MFLYFASLILMIPPFPFLIKIIIVYIHYASITIMSISSLISATLLLMIYTKQLRSKLLILAAAALLVYGLIGIVPPIMLAVQVILPIIPWDIYALVVGNYLNMYFVGFVFVMNIPIFIVFGASICFLGRKYDSFGLRLVGKSYSSCSKCLILRKNLSIFFLNTKHRATIEPETTATSI